MPFEDRRRTLSTTTNSRIVSEEKERSSRNNEIHHMVRFVTQRSSKETAIDAFGHRFPRTAEDETGRGVEHRDDGCDSAFVV